MRLWFAALAAQSLFSAVIIEEYKILGEPSVQPGQSIVLQIKAYGRIEQEGRDVRRGRVEGGNWNLKTLQENGGWFSKSFRFQGKDDETILREQETGWKAIMGEVAGKFTVKDSVLYTAPDQPGTYTVEVSSTVGGQIVSAQFKVEVKADAPSRFLKTPTLQPEPADNDRYRKLAERYSPYIAQETWFDPRADYLHRFDYDGDWQGDNNWDNLEKGTAQAYVYYAAVETSTHWFLHYNFFHARDYSDNCIVGTCHENDNEGVIVTVRKDGSEFGRLEIMETLAHNNVYTYTNRRELRSRLHNVDGPLLVADETHPIVFLEAGGHGALGGGDRKSFFDGKRMAWKQNTGVTYIYKGKAEVPKGGGMDKEVGYELLPIFEHWWQRHQKADAASDRTFADFYNYQPFGNRPRPENPRVAGAFRGVKHDPNKARPFWGWFDMKGRMKKVLAPGQWALDPAYSVFQSLTFPKGEAWSMDYTYNPYLGFN
jgi:hypothetical protein